ncbi:pseudouridine synthase [Xylariaceae sp. FL0016]|nr:pseudouridine synthase [Xylariaceae sp. FL0016]
MATHTAMAQGSNASMRSHFEQRVGILHFASTKEHGWHGTMRTRYTDFQVHEITKEGEIVHLKDFVTSPRELQNVNVPSTGAGPLNDASLKDGGAHSTREESNDASSDRQALNPDSSEAGAGQSAAEDIPDLARSTLTPLIGAQTTQELVDLYEKIVQSQTKPSGNCGIVKISSNADKGKRSQIHMEIRRVFGGKVETATDSSDDSIKATASSINGQRWGNRSQHDRSRNNRPKYNVAGSGSYLHFSLYKENRDTMDALHYIGRALKCNTKAFATAGTKDRRAATVQRVSVRGKSPASLVSLNNRPDNIKIGDFKYEPEPLTLGCHKGNEFIIVLKNCSFTGTEGLALDDTLLVAKSIVHSSMQQLLHHGFINYYGTQRFGTHHIGTHEIGTKILKDDFAGAVRALLSFDPLLLDSSGEGQSDRTNSEDVRRARACSSFLETGDSEEALQHIPPRCFVERTLIRHLAKQPRDHLGAIQSISRTMRTMYVHAYQSFVWNFVASKRWELYGSEVVKGDIVLVKSETDSSSKSNPREPGLEEQVRVDVEDLVEEASDVTAHVVTEEEAKNKTYSIFDVAIPTPGWDVVYPSNETGAYYKNFMGKEENGALDPHNMRRQQRDFSLPGSYRKFMGKAIGEPTASIQTYQQDTDQLVFTDLDVIRSRKAKKAVEQTATQKEAASAWLNFTQNIEQNEHKERVTEVARRKAEDHHQPTSVARMNETWVETSLDGSRKRVKITRHAEETVGVDAPGDSIQDDSKPGVKSGADIDNTTVDSADQITQRSPMNKEGTPPRLFNMPSLMAQSSLQNEAAIEDHDQGVAHQEPRSADPTESLSQLDGAIHREAASAPIDHAMRSIDNEVTAQNGAKPSHFIETEINDPGVSQSPKPITTALPKVAVILRFALNTSQYATVVIRELQGISTQFQQAAAENDLVSNDHGTMRPL